ncbi:MAG TPA: terminase family protein [Dehalococcoidia bacterium]|nr:terminase family protein [Dehalococcoidia bacterium]
MQERLVADRARDVVTLSATQVGKSYALAAWLVASAVEHPRPHPWWWVAPTYKQAEIGFNYVRGFARAGGLLVSERHTSPPSVRLIRGAQIEFRTWDNPQNLMGSPIAGGVVDEAGLLTIEADSAISSRRSGTLGPLRYIGNPGSSASPFRRLCSLGEQGADPSSEWYGVYSFHRWTWRDKYEALMRTDSSGASEYARFVDQERARLPEYEFRRLYEAEWTEDEAAVFQSLPGPGLPAIVGPAAGDSYLVGVDVAQQQDYLVAVIISRLLRGVVGMARWRGVPYPQSADRLAALSDSWSRAPLAIEDNGPGIALFQDLQRRGTPAYPFTTTGPSKQEAVMHLAGELARKDGRAFRYADLPPLEQELKMYRYKRMPSGNYQYGAAAGDHDDCVMALAIGLWVLDHRVVDLAGSGWM